MTIGAAHRILVVDDEVIVAMLIADMLEDLGCVVVGPALDLEDAMAQARNADFDWAILDLNLEGRSTLPVARVLRERNIPFVFASGASPEAVSAEFGYVGWLQMPFEYSAVERLYHQAGLDVAAATA